jgi:hypothetical protein
MLFCNFEEYDNTRIQQWKNSILIKKDVLDGFEYRRKNLQDFRTCLQNQIEKLLIFELAKDVAGRMSIDEA